MRSITGHLTRATAVAALLASPLGAQERGYQPEDYYRLVTVGEVSMAPTGRYVAFTVTTVDEGENRRHREVWLQPLTVGRPDGEPFRVTSPNVESSSPGWSPDGTLLSFSSRRGDDPNPIWFLRVDGPGGEAFHIDGVTGNPSWSPDGRWIAFTRAESDDSEEREGWIAPDAVSGTLDPDRFDGRVVTSTRYKSDGTLELRPHFSVQEKRQVWIAPSEGGTPRRLTDVDFNVGSLEWSRDSRTLFFTGNEREDDEDNEENTGDIWAVATNGVSVSRLTTNPGSESSPRVSPDGRRIAFVSSPERGAQSDILVVEIGSDGSFTGTPRNITANWDLGVGAPTWSPDGAAVRFSTGIRGNNHLFEIDPVLGRIRQVTEGERRLSSFSFSDDGATMAYTVTDAVTPTELYVGSGDGLVEQKATRFNDSWLQTVELMAPEEMTWTVADGTEIQGWVIPPVGYEPGEKYPLILKIHGGPHSAYGNTFFPTFHVLSASGFFVLYTNPRGSTGYGHDFQYATRGAWGVVDKEDFLSAVDTALARYPEADANRLGVAGGSYGGFMTNWLTATSDRFHAAVTSRSIVNWESWWGTSDAQRLTEFEFYGPPWERRDLYRRLSPISYVENVTAPTLIIHSENDYRTPIGDGEQWFMSLKELGVPVEMVRYPRSSHGLSRTGEPWLLVDRLERLRSWLVHYLIEEPPSPRTTLFN